MFFFPMARIFTCNKRKGPPPPPPSFLGWKDNIENRSEKQWRAKKNPQTARVMDSLPAKQQDEYPQDSKTRKGKGGLLRNISSRLTGSFRDEKMPKYQPSPLR
jgi:hypothetical protein